VIELGNVGGDRALRSLELFAPTLRLSGAIGSVGALNLQFVDTIEVVGSDAAIRTGGANLNLGGTPIDGGGTWRSISATGWVRSVC
jgi:hypothetical protein